AASAARPLPWPEGLAPLRQRLDDSALDQEGHRAHQHAQDRPLEPSPHAATLAELEPAGSAEVDPRAGRAADDPDHHALAVAAADDDSGGVQVDVEPRHFLTRAAAGADAG